MKKALKQRISKTTKIYLNYRHTVKWSDHIVDEIFSLAEKNWIEEGKSKTPAPEQQSEYRRRGSLLVVRSHLGFVPVSQKLFDTDIGQRVLGQLLHHREGDGADIGTDQSGIENVQW